MLSDIFNFDTKYHISHAGCFALSKVWWFPNIILYILTQHSVLTICSLSVSDAGPTLNISTLFGPQPLTHVLLRNPNFQIINFTFSDPFFGWCPRATHARHLPSKPRDCTWLNGETFPALHPLPSQPSQSTFWFTRNLTYKSTNDCMNYLRVMFCWPCAVFINEISTSILPAFLLIDPPFYKEYFHKYVTLNCTKYLLLDKW